MQANSNPQLPSNVSTLEQEGQIPQTVAISEALKDYDDELVTFSFEPYNSNQCRLGKIDTKEAKKLTKELRKISFTKTKHFRHQDASSIACKAIHNNGNYSVLFDGVSKDVEVLEIDYSGAGRIFGFMTESVFNVIAIGKEHR